MAVKKINSVDIGVDIENVDCGETNLKDALGDNFFTRNENLDEILTSIEETQRQERTLIDHCLTLEANIQQKIVEINKIKNEIKQAQNDINNLKTNNLLVTKVVWDAAEYRTLRQILGPIEDMPVNTIRDWLNRLEQRITVRNVWSEIGNNDIKNTDFTIDNDSIVSIIRTDMELIPNDVETIVNIQEEE